MPAAPSTLALPTIKPLVVALAGNPNSGKTTIFNALTGMRQKVGNYPGITVAKKTGRCRLPSGREASVIDLPGTYSLVSRSPDERVAMEVLRGLRLDTPTPDVVIVVVDASNLPRNLYLVSQLVELGRPMVVALNMTDIADRRGRPVSAEGLSRALGGVPVIPMVGTKKRGVEELKAAIAEGRVAPEPDWPFPDAMRREMATVSDVLRQIGAMRLPGVARTPNLSEAASGQPVAPDERGESDRARALAERLLVGDRREELADLAASEPLAATLLGANQRLAAADVDPMQADVEAHYGWIESVVEQAAGSGKREAGEGRTPVLEYSPGLTLTQKADKILVHKVWGLLAFVAIMGTLFVSLFWLADPLMGGIQDGVTWLGGLVTNLLPPGPIHDLWADGIVAGVGAVVVFIPQIAILFAFLSILEDSGYLARAAFLLDRLLSKVGLHGKSFIPLLSSFACAIPGIMAARTIETRRDRLMTIFVAPFMSCSARLPVYTLLIAAFFAGYGAWAQAGMMLGLYAIGILAAAGTAWAFNLAGRRGPASAFILEMPAYKVPQLGQVLRHTWTNTAEFITKAGTTIFVLSVILWALTYYPRLPGIDNGVAHQRELVEELALAHQLAAKSVDSAAELHPAIVGGQHYRDAHARSDRATAIFEDKSLDINEKERMLWAMMNSTYQPNTGPDFTAFFEKNVGQQLAGQQLAYSLAGRFGHLIEPAIQPLGYDWKMGVGLVGAFAAREVFVSTMGIVYSAGNADEDAQPLTAAMRADRYADGRPVWTPAVAVSLLVWFVLAMQCMSTLAVVRRETGTWKWPVFMLLYMNALAYVVALGVYQVASRMG